MSDTHLPVPTDGDDANVPAPGTYWEATEARDWPPLKAGDLVLVLSSGDSVAYAVGERSLTTSLESFLQSFRFVPDGADRRQAEIQALMTEIAQAEVRSHGLERSLRAFQPHVTESGEVEGGASLVPADQGAMAPERVKKAVAEVRNQVARYKKEMLGRQERMKALMEEQQALIRAKVGAMTEMLQAAEEAIWTINLYLGKDETIVRLQDGEAAGAEVPITLRQLVLFMDEESAIAADEGGIDVRDIQAFDEWVLEPEHLRQVIPEEKAVVALKVRRTEKDYGDPWLNSQMNEANQHTYFLMRNGERVFRIDTDLEVGGTLLPLEDEFEKLFWNEHYDHRRGEHVREPLRPGSDTYMKAMKRADSKRRHYMRIALFLQGLLDRTQVFAPLPEARINLLDPRDQQTHLRLIFDAEQGKQIGTGRPSFDEWQKSLNERLDIGQRVVGAFLNATHGIRDMEERRARIYPPNAYPPDSKDLHTIERRSGEAFVILYERGEELWDPFEGFRTPKNRASCKLFPGEKFFLNFDAAEPEDMEYYLSSRLNRRAYMYMVPVLKLALRLKREEAEAEAPFLRLLAGELMKKYGLEEHDVARDVRELVTWWKFKNRTHRALTSDDAKALRMIVREYGIRLKRKKDRAGRDHAPLLAAVLQKHPDALLVAHTKGPRYAVLLPHDDENVFVREQEWSVGRGEPALVDEKPWQTVRERVQRWKILHSSERWDEWVKGSQARTFLTGPEREDLLAQALQRLPDISERIQWSFGRHYPGEPRAKALVAVLDGKEELRLFFHWSDAHIDSTPGRLAAREPGFGMVRFQWSRTKEGLDVTGSSPNCLVFHRYWDDDDNHYHHGGKGTRRVLLRDEDALAAFFEQRRLYQEAKDAQDKRERKVREFVGAVQDACREAVEASMKEAYLAEHGDPELWEDHLKAQKIDIPYPDHLARSARAVLFAGDELAGMTVREILGRGRDLGVEPGNDDRDGEIPPDFRMEPPA